MRDVLLQISGGKVIYHIVIPISTTILELKENIKAINNVDVGRQTLKFNNKEMMNDRIIADYGIGFDAELVLEVTPLPGDPEFSIVVNFCGQDGKFCVKETTSVAELRTQVGRHWGMPINNATLFIGPYSMEDNDAPVSAYYLGEGSVLNLKVNLRP